MKCDKNNNGGAVMKMGYSPEKRKMIFLGICIWIRFLIAFGVYKFYRRNELSYLIPIIAGYSIYINAKQIFNDKKKREMRLVVQTIPYTQWFSCFARERV